jgi:hypothetical protein
VLDGPPKDYNESAPPRKGWEIGGRLRKRRLVWIILLMIVVLLLLPAPIAERYTSPTQDGQYLLSLVRSYGFILTLARIGDSAALGNSGKALVKAKSVFTDTQAYPARVELLYLPDLKPYAYVNTSGATLIIASPPKLVWEIWGPGSQPDVIGFLDYVTGEPLGARGVESLWSPPRRPGTA